MPLIHTLQKLCLQHAWIRAEADKAQQRYLLEKQLLIVIIVQSWLILLLLLYYYSFAST